jgi:hypothetical protein
VLQAPLQNLREMGVPEAFWAGTSPAMLRPMTITIGQLVSDLFTRYEREFHDEGLAAVATQVRIAELVRPTVRGRRPRSRRAI